LLPILVNKRTKKRAMPSDNYPIIVYEIPTQEIAELWRDGGLEALARAIAESIRQDLQFAAGGDIIILEESDAPRLSPARG
jgi:hypothetical protein